LIGTAGVIVSKWSQKKWRDRNFVDSRMMEFLSVENINELSVGTLAENPGRQTSYISNFIRGLSCGEQGY